MSGCEKCGDEYERKMPHQKYCSTRCQQRAWWCRKEARKWKRRHPPMEPKRCIACDEPYVPFQNRQLCCSRECRAAVTWGRRREIKTCPGCEREFLGRKVITFCSPKCCDRARRIEKLVDTGQTVYFVQMGRTGPIKIGRTNDPDLRVAQLQNGNPEQLYLRRTMPGGAPVEIRLHHRFRHYRLKGEWFEPAPELVALASERPQLELVA